MTSSFSVRLGLIILGGALGTAVRLAITELIPGESATVWGVFIVNIVGAFLIGMLAARVAASDNLRVFLGAGVLGGFTTYSSFAVGSVALWYSAPILAGVYVVATLGLGLAAAHAGLRLGRPRPHVTLAPASPEPPTPEATA